MGNQDSILLALSEILCGTHLRINSREAGKDGDYPLTPVSCSLRAVSVGIHSLIFHSFLAP